MLTPLIAVMLAASSSASLPAFNLPPAPPRKRCTDRCAAKYRLPASSDDLASLKDRAVADDGRKCNVVGAQRCLSKGRTIFRTDLTD